MWLQTYPTSALKGKMEYYIEPAAQTEEVEAQLKRITPEVIDPEGITVLDPACGSGHILVEAYDVLKEIYQERGYRQRDIARLILEKNLYGLDIDERAAQLAGFALLMKARGDDRRILEDAPRLNVLAIEESAGLKPEELAGALLQVRSQPRDMPIVGEDNLWGDVSRQGALMVAAVETEGAAAGVSREEIVDLLQLFREGKTLGSLISVSEGMAQRLPAMRGIVEENLNSGELYAREAANTLLPFVRQAEVLAEKYDCVIANPPYMGRSGMNSESMQFVKSNYPYSIWDIYAVFIERGFELIKRNGLNAMVTMQSWMFLSSYESLREKLLDEKTIITMAHLGARAFTEISGEVVQTTAFVIRNEHYHEYRPSFFRLVELSEPEKIKALQNGEKRFDEISQYEFKKVPGSPLGYWVSKKIQNAFALGKQLSEFAISESLNITGDNNRFLRFFWEVKNGTVGIKKKWLFYVKGGEFRKWYGNFDYVVNWSDEAHEYYKKTKVCRIIPPYLWYEKGITWSKVTSGPPSFRLLPTDATYDVGGSSIILKDDNERAYILAFLNSVISSKLIRILNPTVNLQVGNILSLPTYFDSSIVDIIITNNSLLFTIAKKDWDSFEISWDFQELPLLRSDLKAANVEESFNNWQAHCTANIRRMQELETENNRLFIEAYGLQDELTPEVPLEQITLARADAERDMQRLISYAVGCMMGRYSLDKPGLIYADSANVNFDPSQYQTFAADADGIIPVTDLEWFADDACNRFVEFLRVAWSPDTTEENLRFVAGQLSPKQNEQPRDTVRRYFSSGFFKDHLQTYKKRPIYWLFSSGKQKAFECLVYLHRYTPATLSRMRNEYVTPLFGKLSAQIEYLTSEVAAATSTAARNKQQKTLDTLKKKQTELQAFDDELRHYADQRITLDLDDGVKVNYGKFGNLLAETKAIAAETE